jgi:hypothetical protein
LGLASSRTGGATLARVFDRFERWQTLRVMLQVLNFGAILWGLVTYVLGF